MLVFARLRTLAKASSPRCSQGLPYCRPRVIFRKPLPCSGCSFVPAQSCFPTSVPAAELTLQPGSGYVISVDVNGQPPRLRVDLSGFAEVVLNPAAARRLSLQRRSPLIGMVGPVKLRGYSANGKLSVAGVGSQTKFIWFERDAIQGADGIISPWLLPYDQVSFVLRPAQAGTATTALPIRFDSERDLLRPSSW